MGDGYCRILMARNMAQRRGCHQFVLETGYLQPEALALYSRCGYQRCGPFGSYVEDPNSVFMCKAAPRLA